MTPRPRYLSNITRSPSFNWLLRRLVNRILRNVRGIEREPVKPLSESEWKRLENRCGLLTGSLAAAVVCIALLIAYRGVTC